MSFMGYISLSLMTIMEIIGKNVARLRKAQKLSQAAFAEKAGLMQPKLSRIERGKFMISFRTLERLTAALDVPAWELLLPPEEAQGIHEKLAAIQKLPANKREAVILMLDSFLREHQVQEGKNKT